jgi:hypothetical protein
MRSNFPETNLSLGELHIVHALKGYGAYIQNDAAGPGFEIDGSPNESYAAWTTLDLGRLVSPSRTTSRATAAIAWCSLVRARIRSVTIGSPGTAGMESALIPRIQSSPKTGAWWNGNLGIDAVAGVSGAGTRRNIMEMPFSVCPHFYVAGAPSQRRRPSDSARRNRRLCDRGVSPRRDARP